MVAKYQERVGGNAAGNLRSFIERIERLEEEKKAIADDIKEVYAESKGSGFDPKIMRIMVRRRKMDATDREAQDVLVDTYSAALGMLPPEEDGEDPTESSD
jgi:uncharacterized protein (UPF0335 family)